MRPPIAGASLTAAPCLAGRYVPRHRAPCGRQVSRLRRMIDQCGGVAADGTGGLLVLTGAGLSTESGIPDYRSPLVGAYARPGYKPIQYADFVRSQAVRQRYWSRNYVGWRRFTDYVPNASHRILADWERAGRTRWLITQNVDHLHHEAGASRVTELHGCMNRVRCLQCAAVYTRAGVQQWLHEANDGWLRRLDHMSVSARPDADAEVPVEAVRTFNVPTCANCGGSVMQPDVVFFGDNVPRRTVDFCMAQVRDAAALLVVGSSLEVMSSYRFARRAWELGKAIFIVNIGPTRADPLAAFKLDANCSHVLHTIS